ncbi:DUF555 domain-containing protein [Halobaculum sp. MBLA0143]|uniref:DUF555 domain-containing protein n=1 Tax=Halobaculum sp. MBLA0143 TaxID=3079933 RepID=UPI0035236441
MDRRVVVEAAVPVYDVGSPDEAVRIAISKTGEMLNPDLNYVEIDMADRTSPGGEELPPAFIAADEALVALELEMTVFNVERDEHASRIARKEIGQRMENIPLKVVRVEEVADDGEPETEETDTGGTETVETTETAETTEAATAETATSDDDELLPEFEEMVEEESS